MEKEKILEAITSFADQAHGEQLRKYSPDRYIVHPIRVMRILDEAGQPLPMLAAALLHDVLEDTSTSADQIREFLIGLMSEPDVETTLQLVEELTDIYTKDQYPSLNRAQRKKLEHERMGRISAAAQTIKYADLLDNSVDIMSHDRSFGPRYLSEARDALKHLNKGDETLRQRTKAKVEELSAML